MRSSVGTNLGFWQLRVHRKMPLDSDRCENGGLEVQGVRNGVPIALNAIVCDTLNNSKDQSCVISINL